MTDWLLDTNVLWELRRPRPDPNVVAFVEPQPLEHLHLSVVTIAEIRFGIELIADPVRRAGYADWLTHRVRPMFAQRILPIREDVMLKWRLLVEDGRRQRHTFPQPDLIIAATALHHGLTIVTRDVNDYRLTGVPIFNPWADELIERSVKPKTSPGGS